MRLPHLRRPRARLTAGLLAAAAILALAIPTAAFASSFSVKIKIENHDPVTCTNWWIKLYVTQGSKKLSGKVEYYYFTLPGSSHMLEGKQPAGNKSNHYGDFTGGYFYDTLIFPSEAAAGETLNLNVVVKTSAGTQTVSSGVTPKAGTKQCKAT